MTKMCYALTRTEDAVVTLTLTSARVNVLGVAEMQALKQVVQTLAQDAAVRVLVFAAEARQAGQPVFLAGANVKEMAYCDEVQAREFITGLYALCEAVRVFPVPVIALIDGWCVGAGVELAAACDVRIASSAAQFAMPEVKLGMPSVVHAALLPSMIGTGRCRWWLLTGAVIDAETAQEWGLVQQVVAREALAAAGDDLVAALMACGAEALRAQKALFNDWAERPLPEAITHSIDVFAQAFATGEPQRYMAGFVKERP
ncbi:MAG: enoyl-CoA hydratase/isomerase family protein [Neisseriaceae bacterium]|nr:enoyl-CoA hydratase/isomerase family protein [Neisseriaceae bacterium]